MIILKILISSGMIRASVILTGLLRDMEAGYWLHGLRGEAWRKKALLKGRKQYGSWRQCLNGGSVSLLPDQAANPDIRGMRHSTGGFYERGGIRGSPAQGCVHPFAALTVKALFWEHCRDTVNVFAIFFLVNLFIEYLP
jgi:hypothetical protein